MHNQKKQIQLKINWQGYMMPFLLLLVLQSGGCSSIVVGDHNYGEGLGSMLLWNLVSLSKAVF
jgi:hypothetical protein